jgi:DDE superfamily endonuclease
MWCMIDSFGSVVDGLAAAFTRPSFATGCQLLLGWIMCLGNHTLRRVAHSAQPQTPPDHSERHGLDGYYNFFARSAWTAGGLAYHVAVLIFTRLNFLGRIMLLVDDTLAHKRGKCVWGLGWWRDAVASTRKRVATAPGHNWVVLAVAYCPPLCTTPIFALPLLARLHLPGKGQPSCAQLAKEMLAEVLGWFPKHTFTLVADGAYACKGLLRDLDKRVHFVGRMRGDACVYDPQVPQTKKCKQGRKAQKGPKLPKPKEAAVKADRKRTCEGAWLWQSIEVVLYGKSRSLLVVGYEAVWPRVLGLRPIQIVVVRDPEGRMQDCYLFTTDLQASAQCVVTQFAWRWAIEVLFRASKQVMDIEAPKHWSEDSVQKLAPWVWSMQSVIMVWYLTVGSTSPEAEELREVMGEWDSEWSLRHMLVVLRRSILNATINPNSADQAELTEMVKTLKNWANLAA